MPRDEELLESAGCSARVCAHCQAVRETALEFCAGPLVNRRRVSVGALLHDIGRGEIHSIAHAQKGADICRKMGISSDICRIVERHIGAGLTADECSLLGLIPRDCMPQSLEERIVANADNLVNGAEKSTIYHLLQESPALPRKIRRRIFRLYMEMELFRG
jgi:uncharacterized protein